MGDRQPSDAELIQRCRRGEVEPFSLLVVRYQDRVYNLAYRLLDHAEDARDVSQETFVRAYSALARFDPDRPFAPWLFRIATNLCYGLLRKRRPEVSFETIEEIESDSRAAALLGSGADDPLQSVLRAARDEEIQQAVVALPEPYRTVVLLRYQEEFSHQAISVALEMPVGTVKTCLHRARQRLRKMLSPE
jgi:RNA polymerase sigma-70 factor (ECF subfamily)